MGLFDALKKSAGDAMKQAVVHAAGNAASDLNRSVNAAVNKTVNQAVNNVTKSVSTKTESFSFSALPKTLDEMKALPEAALTTPFQAAALTVCALCAVAENNPEGTAMLNFLKGPQPMTPMELQFIKDRFMDGKKYIPFSYFAGANAANDYTPATPYQISVSTNPYTYQDEGYATLHIKSGGADSLRQVKLRRKGEQWFLWEQFLLTDIRTPKSADPWA